jgi:hypothetical protein
MNIGAIKIMCGRALRNCRFLLGLCVVCALPGCGKPVKEFTQEEIERNRRSFCDVESLSGSVESVKVYLELNWSLYEKKSINATTELGAEKISKIGQELQDYSSRWDALVKKGGPDVWCRDWADCKLIGKYREDCSEKLEKYENAQNEMRRLISELARINNELVE